MRFLPLCIFTFQAGLVFAGEQPLRVASVLPAARPFSEADPAIIFHDEFDLSPDQNPGYFEYTTETKESFVRADDGGMEGGGMSACFEKGQVTVGTLKVMFGRKAFSQRGLRPDETFREIYWRVYVKHEAGWEGNPSKLGRATCLVTPNWAQGFIAHVWGGSGDFLCIDPATGIRDNRLVTTKYNDFEHLKWLGCKNGKIPIFSKAESGRWVCVESHVKLNTPDRADGVFELWVDGKLEASHEDLDWHGGWQEFAINAVFLENYWNDGSAKRQSRSFDNFVISTQPIGPVAAARPVVIERTLPAEASEWEVEIAADPDGKSPVWNSRVVPGDAGRLTVDAECGVFLGGSTGMPVPDSGRTYWVRIREAGKPDWSPWHSPFR